LNHGHEPLPLAAELLSQVERLRSELDATQGQSKLMEQLKGQLRRQDELINSLEKRVEEQDAWQHQIVTLQEQVGKCQGNFPFLTIFGLLLPREQVHGCPEKRKKPPSPLGNFTSLPSLKKIEPINDQFLRAPHRIFVLIYARGPWAGEEAGGYPVPPGGGAQDREGGR